MHACSTAIMYSHLVQAPRSPHDRVYVLPLLTIKMNKGTGTPPITTPPALYPLCPWAASWHDTLIPAHAYSTILSAILQACSRAGCLPCSCRSVKQSLVCLSPSPPSHPQMQPLGGPMSAPATLFISPTEFTLTFYLLFGLGKIQGEMTLHLGSVCV